MKNEIDNELQELNSQIEKLPREDVAYAIMKLFMKNENPTEELRGRFLNWLLSPDNEEAKEHAMARCFFEMCEMPAEEVAKS